MAEEKEQPASISSNGFRVGEAEQDNLRQYHALALATYRLQRWEDWTARFLTDEEQAETAALSRLLASEGCDPHDAYRASIGGVIASTRRQVARTEETARALEDLARHYKAEVDRLRAAVAEMLLASDQCDGRMQVHQAAAKAGAFIKYDMSSGDAVDTVEWRQDERKDGAA